ncbi:MAG TPA: carbon storage regulator [Planctomycetaceae bacterium]|nr:carbon storage regulator [Planctomycetaceae bacterium]
MVILDIRGDSVRIGIRAPKKVPVHRQEVYELIRREAELEGNTDAEGNTDS